MIPGAIYLRVSKDDGSQTVENQRPDVERQAAARGYEITPAHTYVDEASGAKGREARPALDRMMVAAARGEFRAVFVWALDRLSRDDSYAGGAAMIGELDRVNVAVVSYQETWMDTTGPFRTVLVSFAMLIAADFRRRLIARTNAGLERARRHGTKSGKAIGRPPAQISDAMASRAAELAKKWSWRDVVARLTREGFANVPNHATLARTVQNRYPAARGIRGHGWRA